jgi:hypothetical protein
VFVADTGNGRVVELPAGGGSQVTLGFAGLSGPAGVAVDAAGDVFVADTGNGRVVELPAGGGSQVTLGFTGLSAPESVSIDAPGDLFVADSSSGALIELPAGGTQTMVGSGLDSAQGVDAYAPPPVFVADSPPTTATVGTAYRYAYSAKRPAGEGAPTYRIASGALPPGLKLGSKVGVLSGEPTTAGNYTFQVEVENAAAGTISAPVTINVT